MTASTLEEKDILSKKLFQKTELAALISNKKVTRIDYNIQSREHEKKLAFDKFDIANKEILKWVVDYFERKLRKKRKKIKKLKKRIKKKLNGDGMEICDDPSDYSDDHTNASLNDEDNDKKIKKEPKDLTESTETETDSESDSDTDYDQLQEQNNNKKNNKNYNYIQNHNINALLSKTMKTNNANKSPRRLLMPQHKITMDSRSTQEIQNKLHQLRREIDIFDGKKIPKSNATPRTPTTIQRDISKLENILKQRQQQQRYRDEDSESIYSDTDLSDDESNSDNDFDLLNFRQKEDNVYNYNDSKNKKNKSLSPISTHTTTTTKKSKASQSQINRSPSRQGDQDKIFIYCEHTRYAQDDKLCGIHFVRTLKNKIQQAQHKCHAFEKPKTITRTRNKYFPKCPICNGDKPCMRDATVEEQLEYEEYCNKNGISLYSTSSKSSSRKTSPNRKSNVNNKRVTRQDDDESESDSDDDDDYDFDDSEEDTEDEDSELEDSELESDSSGSEDDAPYVNSNNRNLKRKRFEMNDGIDVCSSVSQKRQKLDRAYLESLDIDQLLAFALHYRPGLNEKKYECKYCGAKYSTGYMASPWGPNKLCTRHYVQWSSNNTLKLPSIEPSEPINTSDNKDKNSLIKVILKGQNSVGALPIYL